MRINRKLRIAIDCRIADPRQGVGTAVLALAKALSESEATSQEYTFLVREDLQSWLAPYIYGPCKLVGIPESKLSVIKATLRWITPLRIIRRVLHSKIGRIPSSDGYVESCQFDVVHFPTQAAYLTDLPSIYQPWDLQHLHYPQFFSKADYALREKQYRTFCNRASFVCVQAQWTKLDIIKQYGIEMEKISVIPWGSVLDAYKVPSIEVAQATIEKYSLPSRFFFYPAVTWPHKNHEAIIRALHILKTTYGNAPDVYFTGSSTEHRPALNKLARELGVSERVHFIGFLTPDELQTVFATATAMIFPSKFEGFGLPILEAFHAGLPVLSSNATTLPEVARDAALYFDPDKPDELAKLMRTILDTPELRQELIKKGTEVLSQYSMNDTVASFQALYVRAGGSTDRLSEVLIPTDREESNG
jgi:glycosyltransferase involved in cell wall biosynthesis